MSAFLKMELYEPPRSPSANMFPHTPGQRRPVEEDLILEANLLAEAQKRVTTSTGLDTETPDRKAKQIAPALAPSAGIVLWTIPPGWQHRQCFFPSPEPEGGKEKVTQ